MNKEDIFSLAIGSYGLGANRCKSWEDNNNDLIINEDELVANLFRINQTKQRLIRDNVQGEKEAKDVHYEVGKKVRRAIADIGGMMPEEMPTPKKSLKELEREKKQLENKEQKKLDGIK